MYCTQVTLEQFSHRWGTAQGISFHAPSSSSLRLYSSSIPACPGPPAWRPPFTLYPSLFPTGKEEREFWKRKKQGRKQDLLAPRSRSGPRDLDEGNMVQSSHGAGFRLNAKLADQARSAGRLSVEIQRSTGRRSSADKSPTSTSHRVRPAWTSPAESGEVRAESTSFSYRHAHIFTAPSIRLADHDRPEAPAPGGAAHQSRLDTDPGGEDADQPCCAAGRLWRAWLYPELPWGAPPNWNKRKMRGKTFLMYWDITTFLACIYVAIVVPYVTGFEDRAAWTFPWEVNREVLDEDTCVFRQFGRDRLRSVVLVLDMIVDSLFLIDIVLNFVTAQWVICRDGRLHYLLIDDLPQIRDLYLRGNFAVDIISQIPWQYTDCLFEEKAIKMLRMLRMLKMLRLYRVERSVRTTLAYMPIHAYV